MKHAVYGQEQPYQQLKNGHLQIAKSGYFHFTLPLTHAFIA